MKLPRCAVYAVFSLCAASSVLAAADASANPPAPSPPNGSVSVTIKGITVDVTPTARYHVQLWGVVGNSGDIYYAAGGSSCPVGWDLSNVDIDRLMGAMVTGRRVAIGASQIPGQSMSCIAQYTFTA
jgi:hypothetical protein